MASYFFNYNCYIYAHIGVYIYKYKLLRLFSVAFMGET